MAVVAIVDAMIVVIGVDIVTVMSVVVVVILNVVMKSSRKIIVVKKIKNLIKNSDSEY